VTGGYRSPAERLSSVLLYAFCAFGLAFLVVPIVVIIPLSFNAEALFYYPLAGISLRWYETIATSPGWHHALVNSLVVGISATFLATLFGGFAAIGISRLRSRYRTLLTCLFISPMIIPGIITALALFLFFSEIGLTGNLFGIVIGHTILGIPFVVITLTAALAGFDGNLLRAAASLGAGPVTAMRRVLLPILLPAVVSSALFVFVTSFDEFIVTLFLAGPEQFTLPLQMWTGVHDNVTPTILAAATLFVLISIVVLTMVEILRRRTARLGGVAVT
jgi:putative spermidine/putrescine transport system permease protein